MAGKVLEMGGEYKRSREPIARQRSPGECCQGEIGQSRQMQVRCCPAIRRNEFIGLTSENEIFEVSASRIDEDFV